MNIDERAKKALLWIAVVLGGVVLLATVGNGFVDFTADRVIDKLEKDYSPSPYGPGIDPDKVDMKVFSKQFKPESKDESKEWGKTWD
jgi:hypothetical protein